MPNEQNGYCGPHTSSADSSSKGTPTADDGSLRYQRRPGEHLMRGPYAGPIPRIRSKNQKANATDQYEDCSPTVRQKRTITRLDTFRENAIETPDTPSPASSGHPIINAHAVPAQPMTCKKRLTPSLIAYCLLPLIQLAISIGLIFLAVIRLRELHQDPLSSNSLIDFDKPDGTLPMEDENSRTLKIRSAMSVLIPATFQCVAAVAGFWPLAGESSKCYQCIHIIFCSFAVLQWLPSIHSVAIEINQTFVQMHEWYQMSSYLVYVILLCAAAFGAIILPSITLCIAATHLLPYSRQLKGGVIGVCLALGTALIAATVCCFSGYATSRSLTNVTQWKASPAVASQSTLYSFALKEVIVATYILLASVFFFVAAVQRNQSLVIAAGMIQVICILALSQLLAPSRIAAVLVNSRVLAIDKSIYPVSQVNVVLLYAFLIALLLMISIQFITTVISLRSHSTTIASAPTPEYPQQRTSF